MAIGMADASSLAGPDTGESENRAGQVMSKVLGHLKTQKLYQQWGKSQKASVNLKKNLLLHHFYNPLAYLSQRKLQELMKEMVQVWKQVLDKK